MYLTLMSDVSYKSQSMPHIIQILGKTVTLHKRNVKQRVECTVVGDFTLTLDEEGTTVYFESEDDFVKVITMLNEFSED